jgi:putative glutamine amidotransferase
MVVRQPLRPVVLICADRTEQHGHDSHCVLDFYVQAVSRVMQATPLIMPAESNAMDFEILSGIADGVIFPGAMSNIEPARYDGQPLEPPRELDLHRDATTLPLLPLLVQHGIPVFGVCRGFQEMNVAYGGSLHGSVHALPGMIDHREGDHARPIAQWYQDSHAIAITPDGLLSTIAQSSQAMVNSLHHQGVARLGRGLRVEARSQDGLVEAISVADASTFALAVQWHPEARCETDPLSRALFVAFAQACHARHANRSY